MNYSSVKILVNTQTRRFLHTHSHYSKNSSLVGEVKFVGGSL